MQLRQLLVDRMPPPVHHAAQPSCQRVFSMRADSTVTLMAAAHSEHM